MNQLSWLIYFAGIADYLGVWLTAFAVVTFLLSAALTIWLIVTSKDEDNAPPRRMMLAYPIFIFFLITSILVPSRDTVLAIAASEMGEKVLATPQAQRVGAALMNWIEVQSKPAPEPRDDRNTR